MALTEHDIDFEGNSVHFWEGGSGFPVLMLHGSGPGAGTMGNWRFVLESLAASYHVLATDLIGFGESGRKRAEPYFDIALWRRQVQFMLDRLPPGPAGIIGHSLSASLALGLAAANERVTKVLTTGAMGGHFEVNRYTDLCWTFPETRENLREAVECLVYDRTVVTDALLNNRMEILHDGKYGPYFRTMFAGSKQQYVDAAVLPPETLNALTCDVVMMHGRDDQPFPYAENSLALSAAIPYADVILLGRCGHSPALEHPEKLLSAAKLLFG
jgi:2-hydroxymuconate-semialdehyde hydrolase